MSTQLSKYFLAALLIVVLTGCQKTKSKPPKQTVAAQPIAAAAADNAKPEITEAREQDEPKTGSVDNDVTPMKDSEADTKAVADNENGKEADADSAVAASDGNQKSSDVAASGPASASNVAADSQVTESDAAKTGDEPQKPADERILLLAPSGPLVIDLHIGMQGGDYDSALQRLVQEAFKVADEDGDGKATWKETIENPKFQSGQFGNLVANTQEEREQLLGMYDADRDEMVDIEELPRFLTRNTAGGRAFNLRSSNEYRTTNRNRSTTRLLLDADRDGAITADEADAATGNLLDRDADDDEVVFLVELKNSVDAMEAPIAMMSNRRKTNEPDTAVWLTNPSIELRRRWGMVQFLLQELYSYGEAVKLADWPMTPELFEAVDEDHDGELSRSELPTLMEVPPHLVLELSFDSPDPAEAGPQVRLAKTGLDLVRLKPQVKERRASVSLQLPDVELEFFVNEDPALTNVAAAAKAQLQSFDRNKNGYLEKEELPERVPGLDATFESFDADSDGKVYEAEFLAYLQQRGAIARSQVRARAADQEDALFTALDTDGDGRLNSREMRETPAVLKAMDRDGDGKIQSHEIPGSMVVGFVRGNSQQDAQLFAGPSTNRAKAGSEDDQPRWFRGMDANSDREISRREFFGTVDQFQRLDANGDGYLQVEEVQQP